MFGLAVVLGWAFCGFIGYGYTIGYFWHEFPMLQEDRGRFSELVQRGILQAVAGPIGLIVLLVVGGYTHGFIIRNPMRDDARRGCEP